MDVSGGSAANWTLHTTAQNLPAVLNDPNRGKQTNFFTRTWGDAFVERTTVPSSPFLPEITHLHFESYLRKVIKRHRRHLRLISQAQVVVKDPTSCNSPLADNVNEVSSHPPIPDIYLRSNFPLNEPHVFDEVFQGDHHQLQEQLSMYLDVVEMQIAMQVANKSDAFFHAMNSYDAIRAEMGTATSQVRRLRTDMAHVRHTVSSDAVRLLQLSRTHRNSSQLLDKLRLLVTVQQTQPTLQLLLSSGDYVGALDLIASTQQVLTHDLCGVKSLRHLPSQLQEMTKLISKMLITEFTQYAALDVHRNLDQGSLQQKCQDTDAGATVDCALLDADRLSSLIMGLLRQNDLYFIDVYKREATTAAQTLVKQLVIEQLANSDVEDGHDHSLTGTGEVAPALPAHSWLAVLDAASQQFVNLLNRVRNVHDVIKETAHFDESGQLGLCREDLNRLHLRLRDLLTFICDCCYERLGSLISGSSEKQQQLQTDQIVQLSMVVERFIGFSEQWCSAMQLSNQKSVHLRLAYKNQAAQYVNRFHCERRNKLIMLLNQECWRPADVPPEIQKLVNDMHLNADSFNDKDREYDIANSRPENGCERGVYADGHTYITIGTVLMLIHMVGEYCVCAKQLPLMTLLISGRLAELLQTFNARSCQLVLGVEALKTAGLRTISSATLALSSRSLQLVLWMIPKLRLRLTQCAPMSAIGENNDVSVCNKFQTLECDIRDHVRKLEHKIVSIMERLFDERLKEWDCGKPPVPSMVFRHIWKHMEKLHETLATVLPDDQIRTLFKLIHQLFKGRLREQLQRLNVQNNGNTQHGGVSTEVIFYLENMKRLKVLPEELLTDDDMNDIWTR